MLMQPGWFQDTWFPNLWWPDKWFPEYGGLVGLVLYPVEVFVVKGKNLMFSTVDKIMTFTVKIKRR